MNSFGNAVATVGYIDARNVTNQGGCLGLDEILLGLKSLGLANHNELQGQLLIKQQNSFMPCQFL